MAKHLDDVVIGPVDVLSVSGTAVPLDDAPFGEVAEVHAGVATADVELVDHFVHGEVLIACDEEGMELGHCPVDAPA